MKLLVCLTLALSLSATMPKSDIKLEIGAKLNRKYIPRKISEEILTHPSQTRPFIKRTIDGVEYIIAFDQRTREIRYIHTDDKNFRTKNGLRVGSEISVAKNQIVSYPGWEVRAPITPDGWYPVVGYDLPKIGTSPDDASQKSSTLTLTIIGFSKGGS
jgi:hypothetical protein